MKKCIVLAILFLMMQNAYSQNSVILPSRHDAIGVKATALALPDFANRVQILYQHSMNVNNRLEFDLGYHYGDVFTEKQYGYRVAAVYHHVKPIVWINQKNFITDGTHKSFNGIYWYFGGGLGVGHYKNVDYIYEDYNKEGIFVQLPIEIGMDFYLPNLPLGISLDMAYDIGLNYIEQDMGFRVGLGIKYLFNIKKFGYITF